MTQADLHQYLDQLLRDNPVDALYVPRQFTALPESGSVPSDLDFRSYGMLREREPKLEELLTHPAIAIVADPGGGKSVVARAALRQIAASGERVPVFGEVKQYRGELQTLFRITSPADILEPTAGAANRTWENVVVFEIDIRALAPKACYTISFLRPGTAGHLATTTCTRASDQ